MEFLTLSIQFGLPLLLLVIGFSSGTWVEKRHYRNIERRELDHVMLECHSLEELLPGQDASEATLIIGSAVISVDYFKRFLAALRNVFGGQVTAYESLLDRARREALLRMKEQAVGYDLVLNVRIETSAVGGNSNQRKQLGSIEAFAFGTAVKLKGTP